MKTAQRNLLVIILGVLALVSVCFGICAFAPSARAETDAREMKVTNIHWLNTTNVFCIDFDVVESSEQKTNFEGLIGTEGYEAFTDNLLINGMTLPELNESFDGAFRFDVHLNYIPTCGTGKSIYLGFNDDNSVGVLDELFTRGMTLTFKQGFRRPMAQSSAPNGWALETAYEIKSDVTYYLTGGAGSSFALLADDVLVTDADAEIELKIDDSKTINVLAPQGLDVTWESSDQSVATVEGGVVTAHRTGTATITATAGDRVAKFIVYGVEEYFDGTALGFNVSTSLWFAGAWCQISFSNYTLSADLPAGAEFVQIQNFGVHYLNDLESCRSFYDNILINGIPYGQWAVDHRQAINIYLAVPNAIIFNAGGLEYGKADYVITFLRGFSPIDSNGTSLFINENYKLQSSVSIVTSAAVGTGNSGAFSQVTSTSRLVFDQAPAQMTVNGTGTIHAYPITNYTAYLTEGQVKYSSTDPSVVSIDETTGSYTVHKAGTVRIGATFDGVTTYMDYTVPSSVTLDQTSVSLGVGREVTLTPSYPDNLTVEKWESSAPEIATVENGVVHGVADGTATITVTLSNGDTVSCEVVVSTQTTFTLSSDKTTITMKEELGFTTQTNSDSEIEWSVSDATKAVLSRSTGSSNTLTPLGIGTVTVTASLVDEPEFEQEITVTILSTVDLNVTSEKVKAGGTLQLQATVLPSGTQVEFITSDDEVATVDASGLVTADAAGETTITATSVDGQKAECVLTVYEDVLTSVEVIYAPSTDRNIFQIQFTKAPYDKAYIAEHGAHLNLEKIAASENAIPEALSDFFSKIKINGQNFMEYWANARRDYDVNLHIGQLERLFNFCTYERGSDGSIVYPIPDGFTLVLEEGMRLPEMINGEWRDSEYVLDKTYMYEINNYSPSTATVRGVLLDATATLGVGEEKTLNFQINGNQYAAEYLDLSWESSDGAVVTVENGVIKGVKAGTANVTVKLGDFSATCAVTVTAEGGGTTDPGTDPGTQPGDSSGCSGCSGSAGIAGALTLSVCLLAGTAILIVCRKRQNH